MTLREEIDGASAHYAAGRFDAAVAAYRRARDLAPRNAEILHNLGVALAATSRLDEAAMAFTEAAALAPESPAPWLALGHLEFGRDRLERAEVAFGAAARIAPDSVEALYNVGFTRHEQWRFADAVPPLAAARALAPASEQVWYQLYNTRLAAGDHEGALADFLAFEADAAVTPVFLRAALESVRTLGDAAREDRVLREVLAFDYGANDVATLAGFLMRLQYFDVRRADLKRLYDTYDRLMQARVAGVEPLAAPVREPGRTRIGYLSADFRQHVMGRLMFDVIGAHDRDRYAIHLYSLASEADGLTAQFRALADHYVELPPRRDLDAARAIAEDDCDVLVDLMGHTMFSRPEILAFRPARRIVTHLGSHGAIGLSQVDFKITDRHADVADAADYQIERPLPMDSCVLPLRPAKRGHDVAAPSRDALGIVHDAIVFGEFVTVQKLSPRCLSLWRRILARVPRTILLFSPSTSTEHAGFRRQLAGHGIDPARAAFIARGWDEAAAHARYAVVDLVLDTIPYTGGDTTLAALDAGIPVITLAGTRHAERMGASILLHMGLGGLVADSEEAYVDLAVRLASDVDARAHASDEVAARFAAAASSFPTRYTRDLEAALDAARATPPRPPA